MTGNNSKSEFKELARDVHDQLGPLVALLKLKIETIRESARGQEQLQRELTVLADLAHRIAENTRDLTRGLQPRRLKELGLAPALEELCFEFGDLAEAKVTFTQSAVRGPFEPMIEKTVYNMARELLYNALRHSGAETIRVQLSQDDNVLSLIVEDDGIGIDGAIAERFSGNGMGLSNLRYRTKELEGVFDIKSSPGKGVFINVEIPLRGIPHGKQ